MRTLFATDSLTTTSDISISSVTKMLRSNMFASLFVILLVTTAVVQADKLTKLAALALILGALDGGGGGGGGGGFGGFGGGGFIPFPLIAGGGFGGGF